MCVLTVSSDADDFFDALRAGASGYMLKDMDPEELPELVRRLARGEGVLPGALTARLIEQFRSRVSGHGVMLEDGRHIELTAREHDVLVLLADEVPTSEMAAACSCPPVTVRRHVSMLLRKLDVGSRKEAARMLDRRSRPRSNRRDRSPPET